MDPNVTSQSFYVKRVIGLPGDKVAIKGGHLYVNDELILQPYLVDNNKPLIDSNYERTHGSSTPKGDKDWDLSTLSKDNTGWPEKYRNTTVVPEDSYFVMGDHRSVSVDSRFFGYVPRDHVVGVVID